MNTTMTKVRRVLELLLSSWYSDVDFAALGAEYC